MTATFTLSIEPVEGTSFQYGFHLGTIESTAREIAVEKFHARNANGMATRTVALMREGKIFDCYDGRWSSEYGFDD
jgi:hypothetical protein